MSLAGFHANLKAVLATDSGLESWAAGHFARGLTVFDADRGGELSDLELPAAHLDTEDAEADTQVVGGGVLDVSTALRVVVSWKEEDPAKATTQRLELVDEIARAVMRNRTLSGAVLEAAVERWAWVVEPEHLVNVVTVQVRGVYRLTV